VDHSRNCSRCIDRFGTDAKEETLCGCKSSRKSQKKLVETGLALAALKVVGSLARPVILEFVKID